MRFCAVIAAYGAVFACSEALSVALGSAHLVTAIALPAYTAVLLVLMRRWGVWTMSGLVAPSARSLARALPYAPVLLLAVCNLAFTVRAGTDTAAGFVVAVLCAPVLEELCFRGYLIGTLRALGLRELACALLCAGLFALLHLANSAGQLAALTAIQVAVAFCAGVSLGFMRIEAGSVLPCMFAHFLVNATAFGSIGYSDTGLCALLAVAIAAAAWSVIWWARGRARRRG